uniref:Pentatricopeptide repeat-containing protein At3g12770-like n=1 Tax=Cicer arietinum TaxID=3827 RepID=A0A3Q7XJY6_CICAR|nr:pentatricopeptide repeat-containing protein At3g12770-like [Cicer arietinum]
MLHGHVLRLGFQADTFIQTSLVDMYSKFSIIESARKVFDEMPQRSVVSWNTVISAYSCVCVCVMDKAMNLLKEMLVVGFGPSASTFVSILSGYSSDLNSFVFLLQGVSIRCCVIKLGFVCFEVSLANSLMGYDRSGYPSEALNLFRRMIRTETRPNEATLAIVSSTCADLGSLNTGQGIEEYIFENGFESDQQVQTSLIHMYSKCGSIKKAIGIYDRVKDKDLTIWTSMINSYAIQGMGGEAISLFEKMTTSEGLKPDTIVYTSLLLAYLLGRVGQLDLALVKIQAMPLELQARAWGSLLSACRIHGNVELGELAAAKLLELSPGSSRSYVLMANLYTSVGKFNEANTMRYLIDGKGMVKECGWS